MTRLMQTASAFSLAAALSAAPMFATAQQATETEAEQAAEEVLQETKEAAGAATETVGEAAQEVEQEAQEAAGEAEQALDEAAQETEQAVEGTAETTETTIEPTVITADPDDKPLEQSIESDQEIVQPDGGTVILEGEAPVAEVEGAIVMQDENSILTSELLDASVYSVEGEKVGDIDDAILSLDGMVEGVVIGVGGFLGIGEKHVAVEMQQISVRMDENNEPQLIIDTTREALEAAPDLITADEQRVERERLETQQVQPADTAPAAGGVVTSDPAEAETAPVETVPPAPAEDAETVKQN